MMNSRIIWVGTSSYKMCLSSVSVMQALVRSSPNSTASWLILSVTSGRQLHPTPSPPSPSDGEHSRSTLSHLRSFVGARGYMLAEAKLSEGQHANLVTHIHLYSLLFVPSFQVRVHRPNLIPGLVHLCRTSRRIWWDMSNGPRIHYRSNRHSPSPVNLTVGCSLALRAAPTRATQIF
ncbi:hypothetical protein ARMSODRAFT_351746 [Armillaria solidipes]|uniref:Uncharacterized protein n=1 Tax=Armillaria solidipes TaxID=1076256 RepID=A0A2H3BRW5_9AGAR|nr:hypothetical protein ARMSODRAFT_351746 [Armillaria solidipes]